MSKVIMLAALRAALPSVDLGPGDVHRVEPITGIAYQLVVAARDEHDPAKLWDAAALCLPTALREQVFALTIPEVQEVIAIASGSADAVLEQVGNGSAPAPETAPAPAP